jgi:hypothetical protein
MELTMYDLFLCATFLGMILAPCVFTLVEGNK